MKVIPLPRAARKHLTHKKSQRGKYTKQAEREAAKNLPCAWKIGNRKSFAAARARAIAAICRDTSLSGRAKSVLAACIDHMNPGQQFSCFAAMPSIAKEVDANVVTCWRTIRAVEGKYIITRRGKRYRDKGYTATEISIHPRFAENAPATENYVSNLQSSSENYVADLQKLRCKNDNITFFKEPLEEGRKVGIREREEKEFRASSDSLSFQTWKTFFQLTNQAAMVRELENRELCGRAFNFRTEWPSSQWPPCKKGRL
jgi:hypothetical protein